MLLLKFLIFLAVANKSATEESLEPTENMISETFAHISRISLDLNF